MVEAVRHCRAVQGAIRALQTMDDDEVYVFAKELRAPVELVRQARSGCDPACCVCLVELGAWLATCSDESGFAAHAPAYVRGARQQF